MTRDQALAIVDEYIVQPNLRKHLLAAEAAMRAYAEKFNGDKDEWGLVGLLHDFDWEIHPTASEHPVKGEMILKQKGVGDSVRQAILAHAPHSGVIARTPMEKAILAVDELCGFLVACALVMPDKRISTVTVDSVKRKLKTKGFAAKVNREEVEQGHELLGVGEDEHIQTVMCALQAISHDLGL